MNDWDCSESREVEVVKYSSPWALPTVIISIAFISITIFALVSSLGNLSKISLGGKFFIGLLIVGAGYNIGANPLAIGTANEGLVLKYFPNWYRTIPWAEIQFLKRRGMVGRYLTIKRSQFLDLWPASFFISPLTGPRQLELIERLIAVVCQQARLSPKRKTLWGYDVYVRSDLQ